MIFIKKLFALFYFRTLNKIIIIIEIENNHYTK